ncbi:MAG: hypothetical protein FWH01_08300 [Oscillospiraceae bacterium]|nr:hypothetical protein [Oscillospiraceae bacterium]
MKVIGTENAISRASRARCTRAPRCVAIVLTTTDYRAMLVAAPVVITITNG